MARPTYPGILSLTSQLRVTLASTSDTSARGIVKEAKKNACRERGTVMRAVVVYESLFGNTRQIADAIGTGLVDGCVVSVIPVAQAGPDQRGRPGADLEREAGRERVRR
jgi:hypothetical protein